MNHCGKLFFLSLAILFSTGKLLAQQRTTTIALKTGIGTEINFDSAKHQYFLAKVYPGNPGAAAGLRAHDYILFIDDKPISSLIIEDVSLLLRGGSTGQPYKLTIERLIKTSLGSSIKRLDLDVVPGAILAETCLSGDCKNGDGKLINNQTKIIYEGSFKNGDFTKGKIYYASGRLSKEGTFVNGKMEGKGKRYWDTAGSILSVEGDFVAGMLKSGHYYSKNGKVHWEGNFDENNELHGSKCRFEKANFYYYGDMVHGKMTGEAEEMSYKNGVYSGPVVNGKPEGKGTYKDNVSKVGYDLYKGDFRNGLMEGKFRKLKKSKSGNYEDIIYYKAGIEE